jgi:hypothetical protein
VPTIEPAPPLFSTTIDWPMLAPASLAMMRATASAPPPGA